MQSPNFFMKVARSSRATSKKVYNYEKSKYYYDYLSIGISSLISLHLYCI